MGRAWVFGDNVSTDNIIPGRYNITSNPSELRKYVFKYARPEFAEQVRPGDVVIGGKNFGCGSSREHAAIALRECGVKLVANSYGWIFRRNCVNLGVLPLEIPEKAIVNDGDFVEVDLVDLVLRDITLGRGQKLNPIPKFILDICSSGGLVEYLNKERTYV
ncbi:MAG: 3-isopropylmalate dehydratase [Candidatus Bathyarchaeia archaeon]